MMLVQEYLLTHSLEELKEEHGVNYRLHNHKFSLNYDMLEAKDSNPIACECRGLILAPKEIKTGGLPQYNTIGETEVLCRTMPRFFNHGQEAAADIDFTDKSTRFYEKLDGTMCALYFDFISKEWHVATRSVPEADLPMDGFGEQTFRSLFEKAVQDTCKLDFDSWILASNFDRSVTYVFELCTPENRIVVPHTSYGITLLAVADNLTGHEHWLEVIKPRHANIPMCKSYKLSSLKDMIEFVSTRNPMEHEGVVVVDSNFNRVKVKNPGYHALSRIKESAVSSPRALVELCLLGQLDDAVPLLPDYLVQRGMLIKEGLVAFIRDSDKAYINLYSKAVTSSIDPNERKTLALLCKAEAPDVFAYVMGRYSGRYNNAREYIDCQVDKNTGEYKKSFLEYLLRIIPGAKGDG